MSTPNQPPAAGQAAHTPLPWRVRSHPELGSFIEAKIEGKPYGQEILGEDYFPHLDRGADCAFIVLACNSHAALIEALENLLADWERVHGAVPKDHEARAALAAAKEGGAK